MYSLCVQAKFKVRKLEGKQDVNLIECEGIGLESKFLLHHNSYIARKQKDSI